MIPEAAVEAAAIALDPRTMGSGGELAEKFKEQTRDEARHILEAGAPHMLAEVWQSAYNQGVDDERTSQANPGIAGCFCHSWPCRCVIEPARQNPYRSQA